MNSKVFPFEIESEPVNSGFDEFIKLPHTESHTKLPNAEPTDDFIKLPHKNKSNDDLSMRLGVSNTNPFLLENQKQSVFKFNHIIEPIDPLFGFTDIEKSSVNLALMVLSLNLDDYNNMTNNDLMRLSTELDNMKKEALNILLYYKNSIPKVPKPITHRSPIFNNRPNIMTNPDGYHFFPSDTYTTTDPFETSNRIKPTGLTNLINQTNQTNQTKHYNPFRRTNADLNNSYI